MPWLPLESEAARRIYNSVDHVIGVTIEAAIDDTDIRPVGPTIFAILNADGSSESTSHSMKIRLSCSNANTRTVVEASYRSQYHFTVPSATNGLKYGKTS